jgi:ABC-type Zn2+ transport system substrate-binding protein/surface adhesin
VDLAFHLREEVHPGIEAIIDNAPRNESMSARPHVPFITYHAAFQYFLKRYRLEEHGEVTQRPEDYLGAKTLHTSVARAGQLSINCVISETNTSLVQRIARASGAKIVPLSPEATYTNVQVPPSLWARNDYDRLLLKTAVSFAECL